jgi:hypothetical protein
VGSKMDYASCYAMPASRSALAYIHTRGEAGQAVCTNVHASIEAGHNAKHDNV